MHPTSFEFAQSDGWLNNVIFSALQEYPMTQSVLGIVFVFLQGYLLNFIVNKHRIMDRPSLLSGMVFVLISSMHPSFQGLNPVILGNSFLFIAIAYLLNVYRKIHSGADIFNISFFLALASWFYFPYLFLVIPALMGVFVLRSFSFREQLLFLMGIVIVYYLMFVTQYLCDVDQLFFKPYLSKNISLHLDLPEILNNKYIVLVFIVLVVFSFANSFNFRRRKGIQEQKKITVLFLLLGMSPLALFFWYKFLVSGLLIMTLPLAVFLGMVLYRMKSKVMAEFAHLILLILTFVFLYVQQ